MSHFSCECVVAGCKKRRTMKTTAPLFPWAICTWHWVEAKMKGYFHIVCMTCGTKSQITIQIKGRRPGGPPFLFGTECPFCASGKTLDQMHFVSAKNFIKGEGAYDD